MRAVLLGVLALIAMVGASTSGAGAASRTVDATCPISGEMQFSPGLVFQPSGAAPQTASITGTADHAPPLQTCLAPASISGTLTSPSAYCYNGVAGEPFTGIVTIKWSDGSASRLKVTMSGRSTTQDEFLLKIDAHVRKRNYRGDRATADVVYSNFGCGPSSALTSLSYVSGSTHGAHPLIFTHP